MRIFYSLSLLSIVLLVVVACGQPLTQNDVVWGDDSVVAAATGSSVSAYMTNSFMVINDSGAATPYYANLVISGMTGAVAAVSVGFTNFTHAWPDEVQCVLVSPNNLAVKLFGDAGGTLSVSNTSFAIAQSAGSYIPDGLAVGTYKPTDDNPAYVFPADAGLPVGPYSTNLTTTFSGMASGDANGIWRCYVSDSSVLDGGFITNICLVITQ